jgi:multiple sugar transport system permease protein
MMVSRTAAARRAVPWWANPQKRAPWLFIFPGVFFLVVFHLLPALAGLAIALFRYGAIGTPQFIGLGNFAQALGDARLANSLLVTAYFVVGNTFPSLFVGLALALALNQSWFVGKTFNRVVYFLPTVVSMVAVALVWNWLLNPSFGLVNSAMRQIGLPPQQWLGDLRLAMPTVIFVSVWKSIGFFMVIYLAGLQGIPGEYYEAAKIDGAGRWSLFRHITWPLLMPTTFFLVAIGVIAGFQVFDQVFIMTGGGPVDATRVFIYYIWHKAFQTLEMGYASALAVVLFAIILFFTMLQFRFMGRRTEW